MDSHQYRIGTRWPSDKNMTALRTVEDNRQEGSI